MGLTIAAFRVREIDPALLEKVEVVDGDITEDNLGIDEQAERLEWNRTFLDINITLGSARTGVSLSQVTLK